MAAALDVRALPGQARRSRRSPASSAAATLLLVLDNCEHVLAASAALAEALLRAAPRPDACSRRAASRSGFPARSSSACPRSRSPTRAAPGRRPSSRATRRSRLFVERAAAVAPGFALDRGERRRRRADLLPPGRAAARARAGRRRGSGRLGPAAIAERLDDRFRLLRAGSRAGADAAADARGDAALEPRPARARRAGALPPPRRLRRRLRARCGRGRLRRRRARARARSPTCSAGWSRSRSSAPSERGARAPLPAARDRPPVRPRAARREAGEARRARDPARALGARARRGERDTPALDREAANLRAALDTLMGGDPDEALRLCIRWCRSGCGASTCSRPAGGSPSALAAAPSRTALARRGSARRVRARVRAGRSRPTVANASRSARGRPQLGDRPREWRALQRLADFAVAWDDGRARAPHRRRALELARREGFAGAGGRRRLRARACRWLLGDRERAERAPAERAGAVPAAAGPTAAIRRRSTSASCRGRSPGLLGPAAPVRGDAPAVHRDLARGRVGTWSSIRPGSRGCAATCPGASAPRRGRARLRRARGDARARGTARPPRRTSTSPRATSTRRASRCSGDSSCAAP